MRVVLDARMIRKKSMHGIARYVYNLIKGLCHQATIFDYCIIVNPDSPLLTERWPEFIRFVEVKSSWISFKEQWEIPSVLRTLKADLFHAPSFVAPILCPCPLIMTIHDLNHIVLPQFYTPVHQLYYQLFVRSCIRRSAVILTVSHFSKREIVNNLSLNEEKVFVTYNGVSENYRRIENPLYLQYVREVYELPDQFILCISNNKPHKNILQLVKAYCFSNVSIPLVLACPIDQEILQVAESFNKKHLIYFSKFIEEEHLPAVYSLTHLFVYPSTYEGFGLPPIEALACGVPVVVAHSSSLPEVVGDHAIFTDPFDFKQMAEALEVGVNDESRRAKVLHGVDQHCRKFSWSEMSTKTVELYGECLRSQGVEIIKSCEN